MREKRLPRCEEVVVTVEVVEKVTMSVIWVVVAMLVVTVVVTVTSPASWRL